ncbi:TetR family transcriptional regulator C-terminal domain-containing protein [Cypionkella psychrotolerans]|uniref:TetR family transcriptional regulator C-terminal domain-containing protein n=1 Tax=Cypionkella psychrotolerans TaxID=1678131 RepID=UPI0006B5C8E9|nr:TetR family transcriptional regulator C-terminal domain-containing protein [Cypionkella psychrotolerans]
MTKPKPPRKLSREARREQLIEATIAVLAIKGYARVTMSDVANQAGLSHGLVNFHFQSKDLLLAETLTYLADEYVQNWQTALAAAPHEPAAQLDALIRADFRPELCTPQRLAAWCAFWGEAQSRPLYQEKCGSNNAEYVTKLENLCAALLGPTGNAERVARAIRVASEGLWMDLVTQAEPYSVDEALETLQAVAAAFFPKSFTRA